MLVNEPHLDAERIWNATQPFQCGRCLMDRTAPEIVFTETGCNFCDVALENKPNEYLAVDIPKGDKYDCWLGFLAEWIVL